MTLAHFNEVKKNTEAYMNHMLGMSRHIGYPLEKFCGHSVAETVTIEEGEDYEVVAERLKYLATMTEPITVSGSTRASGRYDYFDRVHFTIERHQVRPEIAHEQVQDRMKQFVKRELGLKAWDTLHCRVMDLFKQGKIDWDEVIKAHEGSCEL